MGLLAEVEHFSAAELVAWAISTFRHEFTIVTSFQKEGMVIVDLAHRAAGPGAFRILTLDTGRLPDETYQMMEAVRERYGVCIETACPQPEELESMVGGHGPNLFYRSPELRALCCQVRKVRPLERKLARYKAWAAGLRRDHSELRAGVRKAEPIDGRLRLAPLADWTAAEVDGYLQDHDVPVHPLYRRGYTSIGCGPCTRAVCPGENGRAGRWWWEDTVRKECGIHFAPEASKQGA